MGKRKHRDPAEREARQARRDERSAMRHMLLDAGVQPEDIVALAAEGFVGKHAAVTGEPTNSVTPLDKNEDQHDSTTPADRRR